MSTEEIECEVCGETFHNRQALGAHQQGGHGQPWRNEDKLRELYRDRHMELRDIADELGCSDTTVKEWINRYDIKRKYEDKEWLQNKYVDEGLKISEIADLIGCTPPPILRRMDDFGIEKRTVHDYRNRPWMDKERLKELYVEQELPLRVIADELGCHVSTIVAWVDKHGFEKRGFPGRVQRAGLYTNKSGYVMSQSVVGDSAHKVGIHRLVAVAEYGYDKVAENDVVHHKNGIPWDNRPENLEPMTRGEHTTHHNKKRDYAKAKR